MISRRQTILIARSSEARLRLGTLTRTTGGSGPTAALRTRAARSSCSSPSSAHHLHHPAVAILALVLLGVADRRARVGHEHVVERRAGTWTALIGMPSSANSRGTNCSPAGTPNVTAPSDIRASIPKRSASAAIAASSSSVWIATRSVPTPRLERLGRVERDDLAVVHDRDPVAPLRLVHVVGGHEDRDLLALLELADVLPDRPARLRVESDRRLVEEQHAGGMHQAAGDLEASAHAARERAHDRVLAIPQPDHRHHLLHPRLDERPTRTPYSSACRRRFCSAVR